MAKRAFLADRRRLGAGPGERTDSGLERRGDGERILCLFNFSNRSVAQPIADWWSPIDGHGLESAKLEEGTILLAPFGVWFGSTAA